MMLSKNLSLAEMLRSESAKKRGIKNTPTEEHKANMVLLAENVFQPIRNHFKVPILVSSGYRSSELNKVLKGSTTSQHLKGQAVDIDMDGTSVTNKEIFDFIKDNLEFDQLIWEFGDDSSPDWVHVSYTLKNRKSILYAKKVKGKTVYSKPK